MRISDWSSDVCSSDLGNPAVSVDARRSGLRPRRLLIFGASGCNPNLRAPAALKSPTNDKNKTERLDDQDPRHPRAPAHQRAPDRQRPHLRSEEHPSELQSLMRISYAVFCLKKKTTHTQRQTRT